LIPLVLVTGGTGKTGRRLVSRLGEAGVSCRIAARSGSSNPFDWTQPSTWARTLEGVTAAYLVAPAGDGDPAAMMIRFAEFAIERGVSRFVLLSASLLPDGGPAVGQVHKWLRQNATEWTVLRPSWFMQNFSEGHHLATIKAEGRIYSATEDGRVGFISADDIAPVAHAALTHATSFNADFVLTGSRAIRYDEVADQISRATRRTILHHRINSEGLAARYRSLGLDTVYAQTLAAMDLAIASGAEDRVTNCVEKLTGHRPSSFDEFVKTNTAIWSSTT